MILLTTGLFIWQLPILEFSRISRIFILYLILDFLYFSAKALQMITEISQLFYRKTFCFSSKDEDFYHAFKPPSTILKTMGLSIPIFLVVSSYPHFSNAYVGFTFLSFLEFQSEVDKGKSGLYYATILT